MPPSEELAVRGAAAATAARAAARRRWPLLMAGAVLLVLFLAVGHAAGPYLFRVATLQSEIATQVRVTTGLNLAAPRHARFDLLPSPRIKMAAVHVSDPSGTLTIDAESLTGEVRLLPLLVGRLELASATLLKPKLVIDLDGSPVPPDSLIGRAIHARAGTNLGGDQRLGAITLVDGTATLVRRTFQHPPRFSDIDTTLDWRDLDSPATLTGTMRIEDTATDVAAWIEQPSALMRGDRSAAALRLHSAPLDLSASGDVVAASSTSFKGHLSATSPSLSALLALCGKSGSLPAPFADLALNGDATVTVDRAGAIALDLPSLHLTADGNSYEGTLAYQGAGTTPLLSGTLATEQLALRPFLARLPPLLAPDRAWSGATFMPAASPGPLQLDMRISASHLRLPPFTVDDAALSVMTRGDRLEIGLNEGKAYGGALKGRLSVGTSHDGLSLRGAGALDAADGSALGWDLVGRQVAAGSLSGSGAFESSGPDVAALMAHLKGWARGSATDGDLTGGDLGLGLRALAGGRTDEAAAALKAGRTPFQTLTFDLRLDDGIATIGEASMQGRDANVTATGSIDIGARSLALHAMAAMPVIVAPGSGATLPVKVGGTFDDPVFRAELTQPAVPAK